ncbi:MAG: hypothetical protein JF609_04705 [Verrucomicrobia bacterium]|nr:hypothetical protein [Verrucomicrobiota bacterium]
MKSATKFFAALIYCSATFAGISAELDPLFQNNAVLQCDARVPVWGAARDGEKNHRDVRRPESFNGRHERRVENLAQADEVKCSAANAAGFSNWFNFVYK